MNKKCFCWVARLGAVLLPLRLGAVEGPGTYFAPKPGEGNAVEVVAAPTQAAVTRTVAFLGGSITEMNGFRPRVMKLLREKYPTVAFVEIAAGLSSTCSDTGAFRLQEDVLAHGIPDVFIVESAVNDDQDGHFTYEHCVRGLEGSVRHVRTVNPACEVVIGLMPNKHMYDMLTRGEEPIPYAAGIAVAAHYDAVLVNVGAALVASARSGGMSWKEYKDCHPSPEGCAFVAGLIVSALSEHGYDPLAERVSKPIPSPQDPLSYASGRSVPFDEVECDTGWHVSKPDWDSIPGSKRPYFIRGPILWSEAPGALARFSFEGTALGLFVTAGPDVGIVEMSLDGGPFKAFPLAAPYDMLHYPYTKILADGIEPRHHEAVFRVASDIRQNCTNSAVRVQRIFVNGYQ